MLTSSKLVGFVPTTQPEVAKGFYRDVLGLKLLAEDPYALTFDAAGTTLRITTVEALTPQPFTVLGWWVDDVAATAAQLTAAGVELARFDGMDQDDVGIWKPPGSRVGVVWIRDPDGNTLSVTGFVP